MVKIKDAKGLSIEETICLLTQLSSTKEGVEALSLALRQGMVSTAKAAENMKLYGMALRESGCVRHRKLRKQEKNKRRKLSGKGKQ